MASESVPGDKPAVPPELLPPAATRTDLSGRLHPLTLGFETWNVLRSWVVPLIVVFVLGKRSGSGEDLFARFPYIVLGLAGLQLLSAILRYFTFSYQLLGDEFVTREGLIEKKERHIPLDRIQDLRLEQQLAHRLCRVAVVQVETGGGGGVEASLAVISVVDAERLRQAIFLRKARAARPGGEATSPPSLPELIVIRRLSLRELVVAGLTSNRMASSAAILVAAWVAGKEYLPEAVTRRFEERFERSVTQMTNESGFAVWRTLLLGGVLVVAVGVSISVAGAIVTFFDFTLSRRGEDIHRGFGLLTRRASSVPRRRIQALLVEEGWPRRWLGLASLRADTAGSPIEGAERRGRDVLLPIARRTELPELLGILLPGYESTILEWHRVSRVAVLRGTIAGGIICIGLSLLMIRAAGWFALGGLALIPLIYWAQVRAFRLLGYSSAGGYFQVRTGWLDRTTGIVPWKNIQTIAVSQGPIDRLFGVATVAVDTAGGSMTGGMPRTENVPLDEALALARRLGGEATRTRSGG